MLSLPSKIHHIHLIAICGTGMGGLAGLLKEKGYHITGSDQNIYPPMSLELEKMGIQLHQGYKPENLKPQPDLVIVGNVVSKNNPEVEELLRIKIPYLSMPQALSHFFLSDHTSLVVAGTHGKTTTSALLSHLLHEMGADPSFLIGGVVSNFKKNYRLGGGKYFVVEGDEYDTAFFDKGPKFLHYQPLHTIITSLEFDHADIYRDIEHLEGAFEKLIKIIPKEGSLLACSLYPRLLKLLPLCQGSCQTYGLDERDDWSIQNFDVFYKGKSQGRLVSPLAGRHNALNVLSAYALLVNLGFKSKKIEEALLNFKGVKRRQEVYGEAGGIVVIDDFAHHPTAVAETIEAMKEKYKGKILWAVFEPRSNTSKRALFQKEYAEAFGKADRVILADVFMPEKVPDGKILDVDLLARKIEDLKIPAHHISGVDAIVTRLVNHVSDPSVILIMSNGGFGGIHQKLIEALKKRHGE